MAGQSCRKKFSKSIEEMSKQELNDCLKSFYTSARKQDGSYYKTSLMKSIRAAIDINIFFERTILSARCQFIQFVFAGQLDRAFMTGHVMFSLYVL